MNTEVLERLRTSRQHRYTTFGCRRDALFESIDTLLTTPVIEHPFHLSLAPGFQRSWGSIYDALNADTMSLPHLEHLVAAQPLETSLHGMRSMPVSGRAAMQKPALTRATTVIPPIILTVSP